MLFPLLLFNNIVTSSRQGKLRGLQLALVASAELHLQVTMELEKLKRDSIMGLILMRNKVTKEEWTLQALIVSLELFLDTYKPNTKYEQFRLITESYP